MRDPVPRSGIEPGLPALEARSPSHWTTREVPSPHYSDRIVTYFLPRMNNILQNILRLDYVSPNLLGGCESNCSFALLNSAVWYWNMFSNKCGYVIHCFNANFSLYVFWLMTYYLLFILYLFYTTEMMLDKKQIQPIFYLRSKWVIKQQRQFEASTTHLAQELITYSAVAVQEVLQKRREPCRWADWLAIRSWQQPVESSSKMTLPQWH